MSHTDRRAGPDVVARPDGPFGDVPLATTYTAPCRRCGQRVHLTEDELVASLTTLPACWRCDGSPGAAPPP